MEITEKFEVIITQKGDNKLVIKSNLFFNNNTSIVIRTHIRELIKGSYIATILDLTKNPNIPESFEKNFLSLSNSFEDIRKMKEAVSLVVEAKHRFDKHFILNIIDEESIKKSNSVLDLFK